MKRIHWSKIFGEMEKRHSNGKPATFSFRYAKQNGELKYYHNCRLSSIHFKGATLNILVGHDQRPKTFRKILITEFNDQKVYL